MRAWVSAQVDGKNALLISELLIIHHARGANCEALFVCLSEIDSARL